MAAVRELQTDFAAAVGRTIRTMRKARRLTQAELAAKAGLTRASVRAWEVGQKRRHNLPNLHNLRLLCLALDLPMWRFVRAVEWSMSATEKWKLRDVPPDAPLEALTAAE